MRAAGLIFFVLISLIAITSSPEHRVAAVAGAATAESVEKVDCASTTGPAADVTFSWRPNDDAVEQWLDISVFDDGFVPDTFFGAGLAPKATNFTWKGLLPNIAWFWRLNTRTNSGWLATQTHVFVTCAATELDASVPACSDQDSTAVFSWNPSPLHPASQWLDVSVFDNGFLPGTFTTFGPLDPAVNSVNWPGLPKGTLSWRVNSQTDGGWMTSDTKSVSSCAAPDTLAPRYRCLPGQAVVEFRWAPSDPQAQQQWLDITTNFNGFVPNTFLTSGPLSPDTDTYVWRGIIPSLPTYYRVNVLTDSGWKASVTRRFVAECGQSASRALLPPPPVQG